MQSNWLRNRRHKTGLKPAATKRLVEVIDSALRRIRREVVQQVPDVMKERRGDKRGWCTFRRRKLRTLQRMLFLGHIFTTIFGAAMRGKEVDNGGCRWMEAHKIDSITERCVCVLNGFRMLYQSSEINVNGDIQATYLPKST
jgi:hypothetical protein